MQTLTTLPKFIISDEQIKNITDIRVLCTLAPKISVYVLRTHPISAIINQLCAPVVRPLDTKSVIEYMKEQKIIKINISKDIAEITSTL